MAHFSEQDRIQIKDQGISQDDVEQQIHRFREGFPPMKLKRAATIGDGILKLSDDQINHLVSKYDSEAGNLEILKFVPASGAASRMFKALFGFMNEQLGKSGQGKELINNKEVSKFFEGLESFAFYKELENVMASNGLNLNELKEDGHYAEILEYLLEPKGLNYGNLPKGLLTFHTYEQGNRTPLEEHLVEGASYAMGGGKKVNVHFTVSPDHLDLFSGLMEKIRDSYESLTGARFNVGYSTQNPATDTIAVTPENEPFRNDDGSLLFRPAGHGALLDNLNHIDADIIYIKNIDNVVPDRIKPTTVEYKKALAGLLLQYRNKIFNYLSVLDNSPSEDNLNEIGDFLRNTLNQELDETGNRVEKYRNKLDRPLRVCGMVINTGEPGGGPFWCVNPDKSVSLQIVESSQMDLSDSDQERIFRDSTHFNPVDVIASVKKHDGSTYDLMKYRDPGTGFISSKSKDGRELKAMELPGLWNGSMSDWNTILVEVPAITFNPVKTVNDLLRDEHQ